MNFLHLTVWSSRARLTSDVVLLCKEAPSTVCCAFQKLLVNTGWKYILKRIHVKICHKKCLPSFSQFIKYTHFLVPFFLLPKAPFGPHFTQNQVPILKKLRSPSHVRAVTLILSVFSYIVFICLYFHIDVFCISISVYFCCFLILCIFRFFVPFVHGARDCLLLWTPFKKTSYLNPT